MKDKPYKLTKKEKDALKGLCKFLVITEPSPIREFHFRLNETKTHDVGILTVSRQRDFDDKNVDVIRIVTKTPQ